jgi:hypothetical protein
MISDDDITKALDRIARTADGEMLYRFMQKTLMSTLAEHAPDDGALRTEHGMRRFAQNLMAKMVKGIDESGGRTDISPSERTVIFRAREPQRVAKHVSARDYLRDNDPELASFKSGDGTGR